jgi:hypothetical protein
MNEVKQKQSEDTEPKPVVKIDPRSNHIVDQKKPENEPQNNDTNLSKSLPDLTSSQKALGEARLRSVNESKTTDSSPTSDPHPVERLPSLSSVKIKDGNKSTESLKQAALSKKDNGKSTNSLAAGSSQALNNSSKQTGQGSKSLLSKSIQSLRDPAPETVAKQVEQEEPTNPTPNSLGSRKDLGDSMEIINSTMSVPSQESLIQPKEDSMAGSIAKSKQSIENGSEDDPNLDDQSSIIMEKQMVPLNDTVEHDLATHNMAGSKSSVAEPSSKNASAEHLKKSKQSLQEKENVSGSTVDVKRSHQSLNGVPADQNLMMAQESPEDQKPVSKSERNLSKSQPSLNELPHDSSSKQNLAKSKQSLADRAISTTLSQSKPELSHQAQSSPSKQNLSKSIEELPGSRANLQSEGNLPSKPDMSKSNHNLAEPVPTSSKNELSEQSMETHNKDQSKSKQSLPALFNEHSTSKQALKESNSKQNLVRSKQSLVESQADSNTVQQSGNAIGSKHDLSKSHESLAPEPAMAPNQSDPAQNLDNGLGSKQILSKSTRSLAEIPPAVASKANLSMQETQTNHSKQDLMKSQGQLEQKISSQPNISGSKQQLSDEHPTESQTSAVDELKDQDSEPATGI